MRLYEQVGVDVDGARYCLECAPCTAEEAEAAGAGGVVFAGDVEQDDRCDTCGRELV